MGNIGKLSGNRVETVWKLQRTGNPDENPKVVFAVTIFCFCILTKFRSQFAVSVSGGDQCLIEASL